MFNSHRDDRRRRALAEDWAGETSTTVASAATSPKPSGKQDRYTVAARRENHRRTSDFVPRGVLAHVLWWLAGLTATAGLLAGYATLSDSAAAETGGVTAPLFQLSHGGSLIGWFSSTMFALAAIGSVLVYCVRRHRLDDYRGSYRLWLWSAAAWLVMSIDATANLHTPFSLAMAAATGWTLSGSAAVWWIGVWGLLLSILALRLAIEMRECRSAMVGIVTMFILWTSALMMDLAWIPVGEHAALIAAACRLVGQVTLLFSIGLYARHVLLDAEGLLPAREPKLKREKPARKEKSSFSREESAESGKSTKVDAAHKAADKRTDLQPHAPTASAPNRGPLMSRVASIAANNAGHSSFAPNRSHAEDDDEDDREPLSNRYDSDGEDDDDSSSGNRKLSRAERKRLRKLQRQQRE